MIYVKDMTAMDRQPHRVLQTPELLEHILGFCQVEDLMSCRQVSTFWRMLSSRQWRSSARVDLRSQSETEKFLQFVSITGAEECFGNFLLEGRDISEVPEQFWTLLGENIKVLALCGFKFPTATQLHNIIYQLTPNMEELILDAIKVTDPERDVKVAQDPEEFSNVEANFNLKSLTIEELGRINISCVELLSRFPAIKSISVQGTMEGPDEIFRSINAIRRRYPEKLMLTSVNTLSSIAHADLAIYEDRLQVLTDPSLHLKHIAIAIAGETSSANLRTIINVNCQSLQKLEIRQLRDSKEDPYMDPLPIFRDLPGRLQNLTLVTLHTNVFTSLRFLEFTPNLETLDIRNHRSDTIFPPSNQPPREYLRNVRLMKCKELRYCKVIEMEDLEDLIESMPNLERLYAILDNEKFSKVCEGWTSLVSLDLQLYSDVDDEGITGMCAADVEVFNEKGKIPSTVRKPNIINLPNLRKLTASYLSLSVDSCGYAFGIGKHEKLEVLWAEENAQDSVMNLRVLHDRYEDDDSSLDSHQSNSFIHSPSDTSEEN